MDDYIERQATIKRMKELHFGCKDFHICGGILLELTALEAIPAADVRPVVRAHWEEYEFMGERAYRCSNCKCMAPASWSLDGSYYLEGNYCDFCGSDMSGGVSDE